jgi:tRNA nucleotidyltransferase (CCA-adding enzyme)
MTGPAGEGPRPVAPPDRLTLPVEVVEIATTLERAGYSTWCVGGAIRDALLGSSREDVDLATAATPREVQAIFKRTVPVGLKFGTVGVLDRRRHLHEVTTFRKDVATDGRHAVVAFGASLEEDLARRDFTINAIAYHPLTHQWRDPFGGMADLGRRVVRAVGPPEDRFREDYLRILRAIRFACRLDFVIDPETWRAARSVAGGLGKLSAERVRDEWYRSLETAQSVARLLDLWRDIGAAERWLSGMVAHYPFATGDPRPRDPVLLTAIISADPTAALAALKAATAEIDRARRISRGPAVPNDDTPAAVRRWLAAVEPAADDLVLAYRLVAGRDPGWAAVIAGIRERREPISRGDLAVTGDDLIGSGMAAGPAIGRTLAWLLERVLDDPSLNQRDRLLALARDHG